MHFILIRQQLPNVAAGITVQWMQVHIAALNFVKPCSVRSDKHVHVVAPPLQCTRTLSNYKHAGLSASGYTIHCVSHALFVDALTLALDPCLQGSSRQDLPPPPPRGPTDGPVRPPPALPLPKGAPSSDQAESGVLATATNRPGLQDQPPHQNDQVCCLYKLL